MASGVYVRQRYVTARKSMTADDLRKMKLDNKVKVTIGDSDQMERDSREMLKDFE